MALPPFTIGRLPGTRLTYVQLRKVPHYQVSSMFLQLLPSPSRVHPYHHTEAALTTCFNAGDGILNYGGSLGTHLKPSCRLKENVRSRLAFQSQSLRILTIHPDIKKRLNAG